MHDVNKHKSSDAFAMTEGNHSEMTKVISEGVGHVEQLQRNFSVWSVIGIAFSLANSWFGISTALATGINSGGPVLLVYGIIFISVISLAIAISLAELASAMPDAGAQYYWASRLAPPRFARFVSYLTGWIAWAGSVFTCASVALGVSSLCLGCIQLNHPDLYGFHSTEYLAPVSTDKSTSTIKAWMVFVGYQIVNWSCAIFNLYSKTLPPLSNITLWISLVSFFVILVAVPAKAPSHQSHKFVFATFVNGTGWNNNAIALIVGLINPNWAMNGLDCACHMAEEINNPERLIPIAILATVGIGFVTAWSFAISMMFSIGDFEAVAGTGTGTPILELFYQALGSKGGAITLQSLLILTGCGCLIASHTWQARLCWSFARDRGLPGSKWLSQIHPTADVPIYAHIVSTSIVSALGCLYLGSYTAFNSMVTACVTGSSMAHSGLVS
ncbi:choline transport protein, partial [Aureobasidium melanogenum]